MSNKNVRKKIIVCISKNYSHIYLYNHIKLFSSINNTHDKKFTYFKKQIIDAPNKIRKFLERISVLNKINKLIESN